MKKMLRSAGALLVCSALLTPAAQAYLNVVGNGTAPATFVTTINKAYFFRPTGEYYFGLNAGGTSLTTGNYAVSYASYRTADTAPVLTPLATSATLSALGIDHLAVVPNAAAVTSPTIVAVPNAIGANQNTVMQAISKTDLTPVAATALNDPNAAVTGGIRALSFSRSSSIGGGLLFAAVKINGAGNTTPFGAGTNAAGGAGTGNLVTNADGIAATSLAQTAGVPAWTLYNATTGAVGNTAQRVDCTYTGSYIFGQTGTTGGTIGATNAMQGVNPAFCYDEQLQRLYVGIQGQVITGGGGNQSGIIGVGIYPVTVTATTLQVGQAQLPVSTPSTVFVVGNSYAVGSQATAGPSTTSILKLRTMHTSTGLPYLIVNGNSAAGTTMVAAQAAPYIYAYPLVASGTNIGSFASQNSGNHSIIAGAGTAATDLVQTTSAAAKVGGTGVLPIEWGTGVTPGITDIYVDNDTVYVATGQNNPAQPFTVSTATENGLWASQAVFNDLGQIDHWTDWQKVAPSDMGGNTAEAYPNTGSTDARIDFAAVDSYTGHVWVANSTAQTVNVTQWLQPSSTTPNNQTLLAAAVNNALGTCYSVLDLNASTTNWGAATPIRMTLFGGEGQVCFAVTGSAIATPSTLNGTYTSINATMADTVYDYTNTLTFYTSSLPTGAGAVIALGWSGWDPNTATGATTGFFFAGCAGTAGTNPGLYVYTPTGTLAGAGFNPVTLGATHSALFDLGLVSATGTAGTGAWNLVTNVSGMPVKIQAMGGGVHVLTRTATLDRIYSTGAQATGSGLNTSFVVTASSATGSLASVQQIYDFVVSVSATPAAATPATGFEQLLMLTSDGIYTTSSSIGMQAANGGNLNQTNAGWTAIDNTSAVTTIGLFSDYIQVPAYTRAPQTFWFANYAVNAALANTATTSHSSSGVSNASNGSSNAVAVSSTVPTSVYNLNMEYQLSRQGFITGNAGTLTNAITFSEDPTNTATFNGATQFNQTTAPTIYASFPVLYRLFYNDGARRFFIQKNPENDGTYQVLALPYNLYDYNITANGKEPMTDSVVAAAGAFYWITTVGDTGRLMMGTSNGVIALQ